MAVGTNRRVLGALSAAGLATLLTVVGCSSSAPSDLNAGTPPGYKGSVAAATPAPLPPADDPGSVAGLSDPSHLTPHDGDVVVKERGAVIENLDIRGSITVKASDVTIRNVRVRPPEGTQVDDIPQMITQLKRSSGLIVEHVEVDGESVVDVAINDLGAQGIVVRSSNLHHVGNGVGFANNALVEGNWIHDIISASDWHPDGIQTDASRDFTVRNNRVISGRTATSAIGIWADLGDTRRGVVEGNVVAGAGFVFYAQEKGRWTMADVVFRDNVISTQVFPDGGGYGIWYPDGIPADLVREGNVFEGSGAPANG